jgi:hypothetical protein
MDDSLTILFCLANGKTPRGERGGWNVTTFVQCETVEERVDQSREDLGVGTLLDDPAIVAVQATWLDDYDDNNNPILAVTGLYRPVALGTANAQAAVTTFTDAVEVPYLPTGTQITEWIATYMIDNVYHDGMEPT